jgi:tRNA G18 (ribose-2'-O)-methylase SpoU
MCRDAHPIDDWGDERIAAYRDIGNHEALRARGLFVAEGRLVVKRLIEDDRFDVESILVTPAARVMLSATFSQTRARVFVCAPELVNSITGFNFHRGCLALARRPAVEPGVDALYGTNRLLVLEGVGNPDNVGGMFRSAFALGAAGVVLDDRSADPLYRKAIRTSMAATLRVPFARAPLMDALPLLRANGFQLIALTPSADAVDVRDVKPSAKIALLLGSEGGGLSREALHYADLRARIAIDAAADSLNVSVAAGIALHALR